MKLHANAALSLKQRERMVLRVLEHGWSIAKAAEAAEVSDRTCSKWVTRYRQEGAAGLLDRSSAPAVVANRTAENTVQLLAALRRLRFTAPELADLLDLPASTISGILKRIGMGKLGRLGQEPPQRYERARPGELIHIDVKKLGRITGGAGKRITGGHGRNPRRQVTDAAIVTWTVAPLPVGGSRVTLVHDGWPDTTADDTARADHLGYWEAYLEDLAALLAG